MSKRKPIDGYYELTNAEASALPFDNYPNSGERWLGATATEAATMMPVAKARRNRRGIAKRASMTLPATL